jgi:hypothetical protein
MITNQACSLADALPGFYISPHGATPQGLRYEHFYLDLRACVLLAVCIQTSSPGTISVLEMRSSVRRCLVYNAHAQRRQLCSG